MSNPYRLRFTEDELPPKRKAKSTEAKTASVPQPPTLRHSEDMRGHKAPKLIHAADEMGLVELHRSASKENEDDNVAKEHFKQADMRHESSGSIEVSPAAQRKYRPAAKPSKSGPSSISMPRTQQRPPEKVPKLSLRRGMLLSGQSKSSEKALTTSGRTPSTRLCCWRSSSPCRC